MQINSYTIKAGDYVRCFLPKRQRIVPCKVESIEHSYFVVTPLAKTGRGIHHYHILTPCDFVQIEQENK